MKIVSSIQAVSQWGRYAAGSEGQRELPKGSLASHKPVGSQRGDVPAVTTGRVNGQVPGQAPHVVEQPASSPDAGKAVPRPLFRGAQTTEDFLADR
jgi:hypothetical protein